MKDSQALWTQTAAEAEPAFALSGHACDVAVVGGGYTGLSVALHCALAGLSVQVFEAQGIGQGGSGRNVGLVNAGLWLPPDRLSAALGADFLRRFAEAPAQVFDLIERFQIRCEVTRAGTIHAAHAPSAMGDLRARHAGWQRIGAPVDLLDADGVAEMTGTRAFAGGLWDHRAGTVNPLGYARGLARAAVASGARIATGTPVSSLRKAGRGWQVVSTQGTVEARHVVLAANAYSDMLWPGLDRCWSAIHFFQLATPPLGDRAAGILGGGQGLWDTARIMRSVRKDAQGRLIVGSMGRLVGTADHGLSQRWGARLLRRLYPQLQDVGFESGWHGRIAMTPDHLPRILRLDTGLYAPIGFNGRGITTGTVFGQALADLLAGGDPKALPLPLTDPRPLRIKPVTERVYDLAFLANLCV